MVFWGKIVTYGVFVANFIADGLTRFLCYFLGAKCALVLFFTLLECLFCISSDLVGLDVSDRVNLIVLIICQFKIQGWDIF